MKKYPKYKDSGVEWIGEIPENWTKTKFKLLVFYQEGPGLRTFQFTEFGIRVICVSNITERGIDFETTHTRHISWEEYEEKYKHFTVKDRDILLSSSGSIGKVSIYHFDGEPVILNTSTIRIHSKDTTKILNEFLPTYLSSTYVQIQLRFLMTGGIVNNFGPSHLDQLFLYLPPLPEQQQIVTYLDQKTSLIDQIISVSEKKIELLKEQRTATINHAVTKGLNPKVKMKDSGVEWIGEIPEGWENSKVKWELIFHNNKRIPIEGEKRSYMSGEFPYYGASGIVDYISEYIFDGAYILIGEDGANILSRSTPLSFVVKGKFWVNNHAHILTPITGIIEYFCFQLELNDYSTSASGSAQPKLTKEALSEIKVIVPPLHEQQQIVTYLDQKTKEIDDLISSEQKRIELLKEYRQSLISEVVTGKIRVIN